MAQYRSNTTHLTETQERSAGKISIYLSPGSRNKTIPPNLFSRPIFTMKRLHSLTIVLIAALFVAGCSAPINTGALKESGLLDYDFTMVQGVKPEPGKPLVIEFWATWCGPCHKLFPYMSDLVEDLEGTGIQFVAVTNESFNLTQEFIRVRQLSYPVAVDIKDEYGRALKVNYIPYAVIVNAAGEVIWTGHSGKLTKLRIQKELGLKS
jgi:thiol-disulfide isomerase/thioredoxin